ncbi:hypothetical protein AVEN_14344-1 [Araneus ventricosus]|uniref:Uncharacterized protein n=1 Tax=Araneus ventricosus TaxID=182803 RepID=A0A4Y2UT77_ARAVE|nr:hypothetical protein AVEN_14344-1 [Araneus ventricosus]
MSLPGNIGLMVWKRHLQRFLLTTPDHDDKIDHHFGDERRYSKVLEFSRYLSYEPRFGFLQRFPCDVTLSQEDYTYAAVRIDWDRLGSSNVFGISLWSFIRSAS